MKRIIVTPILFYALHSMTIQKHDLPTNFMIKSDDVLLAFNPNDKRVYFTMESWAKEEGASLVWSEETVDGKKQLKNV